MALGCKSQSRFVYSLKGLSFDRPQDEIRLDKMFEQTKYPAEIEALAVQLADAFIMPFNVQELNDEGGVYYGINQVSKNINIGNRKKLINGNGFVFGVPGSGKSFFCKAAMGQVFLSTDDEIIIIDPISNGYLPPKYTH